MGRSQRRQFLIFASALFGAPLLAEAQQAAAPRIGLLWVGSQQTIRLRNALIDGLRDLGYVDGRTMTIVDRTSVSGYEQLAAAAAQLVELNPNVIVVYGGTATQAARKVTATIPLVMITGTDPVKLGYVTSLSRPGGNITGLTTMSADLAIKQIELLKEVAPQIHRVAIMMNPLSRVEGLAFRNAQAAAEKLGLESYAAEARTAEDFETTFSSIMHAKADALLIVGSTMFQANRKRIVELTLRYRLPTVGVNREYAEAGTLLSYGTDFAETFRHSANYVAKILKGASPAEIPFEQVSELELVVNLKSAQALGITVPQSVLLRASRLIE